MLAKFLRNPENSLKFRYNKFIKNWQNFNAHKQLLYHFFQHNTVSYPKIFSKAKRIVVSDIYISYEDIIEEINVLKLKQQQISYVYVQIIYKLVKDIFLSKILVNDKLINLQVDIYENKIELEYYNVIQDKNYTKIFKLNKFLFKYQQLYAAEYKNIKAWLIVSCDWKDIFLASTCKQWVSCMNLINTYKDHKIKYSNENYVKSGALVSYLILDVNDGKSIDEIMDDYGIDRVMLSTLYLAM